MNRLVAKSMMQDLINGRSYCSISSVEHVYRVAVVGRGAQLSGQQNGVPFAFTEWRRMMSSAPASMEKVPSEKEEKKENPAEEENKGKELMVSSYWGIQRP